MNEVYETRRFRRKYRKLDGDKQVRIEKIKDQLAENLLIGDRIKYEWFREKRIKGERLYFVINKRSNKAVLVAYGGKNVQDDIIDHILEKKEDYLRIVK